jgi:hypothetical protein
MRSNPFPSDEWVFDYKFNDDEPPRTAF